MATTIDNKTVQMNFDNRNFERNISQSMNSLKQMDSQLQTMEKTQSLETLNKQAKQVDFSHMSKGLDNVKVHFSALQVAGATVISELTKKVMHFGSSLLKNTFGQIKSGGVKRALNLEQAEFQVTGLAKSVMKTDKQFKKKSDVWKALLKDVDYAVDGTAYGLDEASKVASQLMASNIKIGGEMKTALRGISGMAAMTGRTYGDIGNIFTKVAGNGRLMSQELLQFSASGLNAAATLTEYLNKNKKVRESIIGVGLQSKKGAKDVKTFAKSSKLTEQNIRTLVTAGAIDFKTFSKAMDDAFGDHATKANETYEGSLMNVKAALSRIGEPVATNAFDNLRDIFNVLIPRINGLKKEILPLLDYINSLSDSVGNFVQNILKKLQVEYKKINGKKTIVGLKNAKDVIKTFIDVFKNAVDTIISSFKYVYKVISEPIKYIYNTISSITKKILGVDSVLGGSKKIISGFGGTIEWIGNIISKVLKIINSVVKILTPIIVPAIKTIVGLLQKAGSLILTAFTNISNVLSNNEEFFTKWANNIVILFNAIKPLFSSIWNLATAIFDSITKSLGILFKSFKNSKSKGFDTFVDGLKDVVKNISDFINKVAELIRKTKVLQAIITVIGGVFKGIGYVLTHITTVIGKVLKGISSFISKIREGIKVGDILKNIMDTIKNGINNIVKILNKNSDTVIRGSVFALLFVKIKQLVWALRSLQGKGLIKYARPIQQIFTNLGTTIEKFNMQIRYKTLREIAASILMLSISLMILSGIPKNKLNTAITAITSLFIELSMSFKSISKAGQFKLGPVARTLISLALSVLILSSALKKVSSINEKDLYKSIGAVSILIAEMIGTIKILSIGNKKLSGGVTTILALAIAIKSLSKTVISLSKIPWKDLKKSLITIGFILGGIVAYLTMSSLINDKIGKSSVKSALSIILVAKAIKTLSNVIQTIGNMSWDKITKGLITIGILLVAITSYIAITAVIGNKIGKSSVKSAASIVLIAMALKMLANIIKVLGSMSWSEIGKGLTVIGTMMASLIAFTAALNYAGKMSLKSAAGILVVALAIRVLAGTVSLLGNIAPEQLLNGLMAFISMLMSLAIALNAMKGTIGGSASLIVASVAILVLAGSLKLISTIPIAGLAGSLITLALTLLIFSKAANAMKGSIPSLMGVAGAMTLLGIGMALLGVGILSLALGLKMIVELIVRLGTGLKDIVVALATALIEFVKTIIIGIADMMPDIVKVVTVLLKGIIQILQDVVPDLAKTLVELLLTVLQSVAENIEPIVTAIINIIIGILNGVAARIGDLFAAIGNLLGAIGQAIIAAVGNINPEEVMKMLLAVGIIAAIFTILSKLQTQMAKAIVSVTLMSISLLILTGVFAIIGAIDNSITEKLMSISVFLAVMTLVLMGCAIIGNFAAQAIVGLGVLIIAIGAITAVLVILGALADKIEPFIDKGGPILIKLGSIIGQFIGAFIGGFAAQAVQALPPLGEALGQFGQKITPFTKAMNKLPLNLIVKIAALAGAILLITASSFINGITSFLSFGNDPIEEFTDTLVKLGKGLKKFNATLEGVDTTGAAAAADILLKLSEAANLIPSSGGWLQNIVGNKDLAGFGNSTISLAKGLKSFVKNLDTSIDVKKYTPYVDLVKKIAEIASLVPRSGGWLQNIAGNKDLGKFGDDIGPLADGIKKFGDKAAKIKNPEALSKIVDIVKKMAEVQDSLPKSGGLWQAIAGSKDWDSLSDGLKSMVNCFKDISGTLNGKDVKMDLIERAVKVLQDVAKINNDAIKIGEKAEDSDSDSESFVADIMDPIKKAFTKIKEYQKSMNEDDLTAMIPYFDTVKEFVNALGSKFKDKKTKKNLETLKTLGDSLANILASVMKIQELMSAKEGSMFTGSKIVSDDLNNKLTAFAQAVVDFSNKMATEYNSTGILNANEATAYLSSVKDVKVAKFDKAKQSVENLKSMMESIKTLSDKKNQISTVGKGNQLSQLKSYVSQIKTGLKDISSSLKEDGGMDKELKSLGSFGKKAKKFSEGLSAVATAFKSIADAGVNKNKGTNIKDAMNEVATAGVENFYKGLKGKKDEIKKAFEKLKSKVTTVSKENLTKSNFVHIGQNIINGIIVGINSKTEDLKKAMEFQITAAFKVTKKKSKINSPSKLFVPIGKGWMEGEAVGVYKGVGIVKTALSNTTSDIGQHANTIGLKAGMKAGEALQEGVTYSLGKTSNKLLSNGKKNTKKSATKLYNLFDAAYGGALNKTRFGEKSTMNLFTKLFYPNARSLLSSSKALINEYANGITREFNSAAIQIYASTNNLNWKTVQKNLKNLDDYINKRDKKGLDKKELKKKVKKANTAVEKAQRAEDKAKQKYQNKKGKTKKNKKLWNKAKRNTKKKQNKAKKAQKKLDKYNAKVDKRKQLIEDIKSSWNDLADTIRDSARSFMDPLTQAVDYGLNLFDKFEKGQRISAGRMLANYASNVKGIEQYNSALETIKDKANKGLISKEMYADLSKQGISALPQIEAINRMNSTQLEGLRVYEASNKRQNFELMMRNLIDRMEQAKSWRQKIVDLTKRGINKDALEELLNMGLEEAGPYLDALLAATPQQLNKFNTSFSKARNEEAALTARVGRAAYAKAADTGMKDVVNKKAGAKVSSNYAAGILNGLNDKNTNNQIYKAAYNMASKIISGTNKRLGINSPAKEGIKATMYLALGMVKGAKDNAILAQNAGEELADAINKPLQSLEDTQNSIGDNPTITPVLDLDRLENDLNELSNMFDNEYALGIAASVADTKKLSAQNTKSGDTINNYNNEFTQNNYSPEALDDVKIYRETKNFINSKVKGGVVPV